MDPSMQKFAIDLLTNALSWDEANDIFDVCKYIKTGFEDNYGGFWCCVIGKRGYFGGTSVKHQKDFHISIVNAQFTFLIYMSPQKNFKR